MGIGPGGTIVTQKLGSQHHEVKSSSPIYYEGMGEGKQSGGGLGL